MRLPRLKKRTDAQFAGSLLAAFLLRAGANSTGFLNPTRSQLREVATHVAPHVAHASFLEYQQKVCSFELLVLGNRGIHRPFLAFRFCPLLQLTPEHRYPGTTWRAKSEARANRSKGECRENV